MIIKFEDLVTGSIVRRKYIYINTDHIKYIKYTNKRILFNFGFFDKIIVSSEYNIKKLKQIVEDVNI